MDDESERVASPRSPIPYVQAMVVCDRITVEVGGGKPTLHGLFSTVFAAEFPVLHGGAMLYLALTNGHGPMVLSVRFCTSDPDADPLLQVNINTTFSDPLATIELNLPLPPLAFLAPGVHFLQLYANDVFLIERRITALDLNGGPHVDE